MAELVLVLRKASLFVTLPFGLIDTFLGAVIMDPMKSIWRQTMRRSLCWAVFLFVCFATGALAQPCLTTDASCTLQLMAPPPGPSLGNYYIDPYTALIGKAGQQGIQAPATINGVSTEVICDDFAANISVNTPSWLANQMTLGALLTTDSGGGAGSTAVKFDQNSATQQAFDYVAGAYLANNIFAAQQANNITAQGEYTYALWELFDPGVAINDLNGAGNGGGPAAAAQATLYL